jgi:hypothetical protein
MATRRRLAETADRAGALGADIHTAHLDVPTDPPSRATPARVAEHYGIVVTISSVNGILGSRR